MVSGRAEQAAERREVVHHVVERDRDRAVVARVRVRGDNAIEERARRGVGRQEGLRAVDAETVGQNLAEAAADRDAEELAVRQLLDARDRRAGDLGIGRGHRQDAHHRVLRAGAPRPVRAAEGLPQWRQRAVVVRVRGVVAPAGATRVLDRVERILEELQGGEFHEQQLALDLLGHHRRDPFPVELQRHAWWITFAPNAQEVGLLFAILRGRHADEVDGVGRPQAPGVDRPRLDHQRPGGGRDSRCPRRPIVLGLRGHVVGPFALAPVERPADLDLANVGSVCGGAAHLDQLGVDDFSLGRGVDADVGRVPVLNPP